METEPMRSGAKEGEVAAKHNGIGRTTSKVVDSIGFGPSQVWTSFLVNGSWLADGSEALAISAVTASVAATFHMADSMEGILTSLVYLGTLLGSLGSGALGDMVGRRFAIISCFFVIIVFSLISGAASSVAQVAVFRLLVGVGFGIGQPSAVALLTEVTPARWRPVNQFLAQLAFAFGEMFCCLLLWLDDPKMYHVHWRTILMMSAIPAAVFFVLNWFFLNESPAFLAQRDPDAAHAVLGSMRYWNRQPGVDITVSPARATGDMPIRTVFYDQFRDLLGSSMFWTTGMLCFICFVYNITVYGAFYAFPNLLPHMDLHSSAAFALLLGAVVEIPFDVAGLVLSLLVPRKVALVVSLAGIIISLVLFAASGGIDSVAMMIGYYGVKGFPQVFSLVFYIFVAEKYPVHCRASGTALVLGCGRIGAIIGPLIYQGLLTKYGHPSSFFYLAACLTVSSGFALFTLNETCGTIPAGAHEDEVKPLLSGVVHREDRPKPATEDSC